MSHPAAAGSRVWRWVPQPCSYRIVVWRQLHTVLLLLAEYDKKKYVWKLLYVYMLGYPVEFGHKQASDLIAAGK
jgi:hypothetical protein